MRTYTCLLSPEQITEATYLRNGQAWPWSHIAERFNVDVKTIRRHCDPTFHRSASELNDCGGAEQKEEHRRRMYGDLKFKLRILKIRTEKTSEAWHFRDLGPSTKPGTEHARFFPVSTIVLRSSPIADCS